MNITPQQVQKLREKSGAGFMDCKRALESCQGDLDKSLQFLREKGKASAVQKAGRFTGQGLVCSWVSSDRKRGSLVELNCESDFVARTKEFQDFARMLAKTAGEKSIKDVSSMSSLNCNGSSETVESALKETIGKLGENIVLKKATSIGSGQGLVGSYTHAPFEGAADCGSLGVLVELKTNNSSQEFLELLHELCLQAAATYAKWIRKEDVPAQVVEKEKEIYLTQCKESGKPEKSWGKIMEGKLKDFYKTFCLLEQSYIRDPSVSVSSLIESASKKIGADLMVISFARFKMGEE